MSSTATARKPIPSSQQTSQAKLQDRPLNRLRPIQKAESRAGKYFVFLWKDQIDASAPAWKRLFFWTVYRPFNHFCKHVLKLPTFSGECADGRLCWIEFQGIVDERWQAEQAAESPNWGYALLPYQELLPAATLPDNTDHNYPLADARTRHRYNRNGNGVVEVGRTDLVRLAAKLAQSDQIIEHFR